MKIDGSDLEEYTNFTKKTRFALDRVVLETIFTWLQILKSDLSRIGNCKKIT